MRGLLPYLTALCLSVGLGMVVSGGAATQVDAKTPLKMAECRDDTVHLRGDFGVARFHVEVADDGDERATGLMYRTSMPKSAGMLFVYERPQSVAFWMRNTLIPLDMIFLDATGRVRRVHSDAVPHDETPIPGGAPDILMVLEINGGLARAMGITAGSELRHPSVPVSAARWRC